MSLKYLQQLPQSLRRLGDATRNEIQIVDPANANDGSGDQQFGILYEDDFMLLIRDFVQFPNLEMGSYTRLTSIGESQGTCGTVLVPRIDNCVIFVEIFRHATREWHWELPRGFQETGLTGEENAIKECKEELGIMPNSVEKVARGIHANTGVLSGRAEVYVSRFHSQDRDRIRVQNEESIRDFRCVSFDDLDEFLLQNVTCGFSLAAISLCKLSNCFE